VGIAALLASALLAAATPSAAPPSPIAGMNYLVGSWKCTYKAGTVSMPYDATYAYDRNAHLLRQTAVFAGDEGDEELIAYDAKLGWSAVVVDDQGNATIMRAPGSDANHQAFRSVPPDSSISVTFDKVSPTEYTLHGSVVQDGKTITNVDTCVRATQ
jgi:hypothetical protein